MHTSIHVGFVQVPQSGHCLLFQTLRGAIDLVAADVASILEGSDRPDITLLSQTETETLSRRGYLTEESAEQEQQQARKALQIAAKSLKRGCEIVFRFGPRLQKGLPPLWDTRTVEDVFSIWDSSGAGGPWVSVVLDVALAEINPQTVEEILASAAKRDYSVIPMVTPDGMNALRPWVQSQNFGFVDLQINSSNMPADTAAISKSIVDYFEHQVHVGMKCNIDGMSEEHLNAVAEVLNLVRRKYPFFTAWLQSGMLNGTQEPEPAVANGSRMPYYSAENEGVLGTLFRFITTPRNINYTPFFQPEPAKLIFDLATKEISYESPGHETAAKEIDLVRERLRADFTRESAPVHEQKSGLCLSCKYALVCGRNWIDQYGYGSVGVCAAAFEGRIHQVLPALLHNIRGSVRPPGASGQENMK